MAPDGPRLSAAASRRYLDRCAFPPSGGLVCAVSGGADSAALLVLAVATGRPTRAVHVDHGLRPDGEVEAAKVVELARALGVECRVYRLTVAPGPNLEARARSARYGALPPDALTGHTADDQAETVLLQLLRGGALDALAAMSPARRPLLSLRRADTVEVCRLVGYTPIEDPSNADPRHRRNRVRHEVLPLLASVMDRDPVPLLARAAALAADERDLLDELAAELDPTDAVALRAAPVALARRAVRSWLRGEHPPDAATVERVLAVARGEAVGTDVGGGRRVRRSRGVLVMQSADDTEPSTSG